MNFASIPELLDEIRAGRMVVIVDDEDRENEGDLIMAAEQVCPADINFMVTHARGLVCLSIHRERAAQLGLAPMVQRNTAQFQTNFTVSIEAAEGVTTGISAHDRAHTIRTAVKPDARPSDLSQPGHIFPLVAQPGGVLTRAGHTEAASDLARLAGFEPAGVLVEVLNPDGSMARRPQLEVFAREHGLKIGSIADLIAHRLHTEHTVERIDERDIDTEFGPFRLLTYRDRIAHDLHFALVKGQPTAETPTLVRVQVENPLADLLHWRREDFGVAATDALRAIQAEGQGVMVVLSEPRDGDALLARLQARPERRDARDVGQRRRNGAGAQILADLGLGKLRALGTPRRQIGLAGFGLEVVEWVGASAAAPAC
ncbi:3,4-dihydroxy-2-butanone-4-phosphate synthase [Pseudoxanthomonas kalamensis DSM 18571]|uniref:3,4-dihydroxy-2-butanone-4-phosphate synthase n=1 Tax=Pseudoxanthomonas kalamensis TaxID=289483 RepID=UPI001390EA7F|nr:3,4-dihydroxy-2-butanone-4-phosphate synthase [Pseudoxanthomonas kalamensis]KAF1708857.1 3,4-dihydroxy-2-butanone-4-phosphate synthase [Pseudoxanthomonas kalamensis DSM 18571]